jgi:hypothetical protein
MEEMETAGPGEERTKQIGNWQTFCACRRSKISSASEGCLASAQNCKVYEERKARERMLAREKWIILFFFKKK